MAQKRTVSLLRDIESMLRTFVDIFSKVRSLVHVDVFYNVYRPLLGGWYPDGVRLEGVPSSEGSKVGKLARSKGPSAGQSSLIVMLDQFLGINHFGEAGKFQQEMLHYMPSVHRKMLQDYEKRVKACGNAKMFLEKFCVSGGATVPSTRSRSLLFNFAPKSAARGVLLMT